MIYKTTFLTFLLLLCCGFFLQADDSQWKDGSLLWAEKCMGCHIPGNFIAFDPDEGAVADLIEDIEFNLYDPESGMSFLTPISDDDLERISRFLTFGSHGEGWMGSHGEQAKQFGSGNCIKCHDNPRLYKEPPVSCNQCHG